MKCEKCGHETKILGKYKIFILPVLLLVVVVLYLSGLNDNDEYSRYNKLAPEDEEAQDSGRNNNMMIVAGVMGVVAWLWVRGFARR